MSYAAMEPRPRAAPGRRARPALPAARFAAALTLLTAASVGAQSPWQLASSGTRVSLRGLSVADDSVVWASGQRGTILRSVDGGRSWSADTIPGAARLDVRAVAGRSALVAHAAATGGRIWRTRDGGMTWSLRYAAEDTSVFLDAIVFRDDQHGLALGDPMGGRFLILATDDGGESWRDVSASSRPVADSGEAAFAASGTSLVLQGVRAWLGSGGAATHVFRSLDHGRTWTASDIPLRRGGSGAGVFSLAFADSLSGVAVGGDYTLPDSTAGTAAFTRDGGVTWQRASPPPRGYRSGAAAIRRGGRIVVIAVGTNGSDISEDGGATWRPLDSTGFNAVQFAPDGVAIAVGGGGRIARFLLPTPGGQ
jgi:photosystem II stability/assembly factor-like uncharacterized protein